MKTVKEAMAKVKNKGVDSLQILWKKRTTHGIARLTLSVAINCNKQGAIVIMGRDNNLTQAQRQDFEVVKRKYKNIIDIITYDDLLRRLDFIGQQLEADT